MCKLKHALNLKRNTLKDHKEVDGIEVQNEACLYHLSILEYCKQNITKHHINDKFMNPYHKQLKRKESFDEQERTKLEYLKV